MHVTRGSVGREQACVLNTLVYREQACVGNREQACRGQLTSIMYREQACTEQVLWAGNKHVLNMLVCKVDKRAWEKYHV